MPDGAPRINGFDYVGTYRYALTVCTHARRSTFINAEIAAAVLGEIELAAAIEQFDILAYCFMPDHVHLLAQGKSDTSDLQRFVKRWKQRTAFRYARSHGRRLWQTGYFDHVLRQEEETNRHILYVLGNPIRAGLAKTIGEYPYAGPYERLGICLDRREVPEARPEA